MGVGVRVDQATLAQQCMVSTRARVRRNFGPDDRFDRVAGREWNDDSDRHPVAPWAWVAGLSKTVGVFEVKREG